MKDQKEGTEFIDVDKLVAAGRELELIANAKREVESMRLVYGVREGLMHQLNAKERQIVDEMHLDDVRKKGSDD